jgi:hypothetical protein
MARKLTAQQAVNALTRNDRFGSWGVLIPWGIGVTAMIGMAICVFRTDSTTHFGRIRPRVSGQIDHPLRLKSTSRFGGNRPS